jgi:CubicO group peptidase (beta-lactamase class C family)
VRRLDPGRIAIADGFLTGVDQTLAQLLPQQAGETTPATASITLRQLSAMTAGLDKDGPNSSVGPGSTQPTG